MLCCVSIINSHSSSGIGKGLALQYARPGVTIAITGRSLARLQDVRVECETKGILTRLNQLNLDWDCSVF